MKTETELLKNWGDDLPFRALTVPPHRGSTVLFDTVAEFFDRHRQFYDGYSYGLYSHPAARALEKAMAALEGGARAVEVLADRVFLIYNPAQEACVRVRGRWGANACWNQAWQR